MVRAQWLSRARLPHNFERGDGNHDVMAQEQKSHTEEGKEAEKRMRRDGGGGVGGGGSGSGSNYGGGGSGSCSGSGVKEDY